MNWYYAEQGKQAGPVSEEQFDEMVRGGKIQPDTLIWREGMAVWTTYREFKGGAGTPGSANATADAAAEAVCAECGKLFPIDDTIRFGNVRVCAGCKPVFLQKLQEGAPLNTGELNYARFGTRVAAYLLDAILLYAFNMAMGFMVGLSTARAAGTAPGELLPLQLFLMAFQLLVAISYEGLMVGRYGGTLGKLALKIKIVTADGNRVSYARAFGRYFAKMLSSFTCLIGFIIAAFDNPQKRALHDYICNTRVVYR
jgi:uncharacterized RDD family membrane protein YckC